MSEMREIGLIFRAVQLCQVDDSFLQQESHPRRVFVDEDADGRDIAYIAGIFITPEIFDLAFCKVLDNKYDCFVKWYLYTELPKEVLTIDSEEDLGIDGLREHKLFRRPVSLKRIWKGSFKL